MIETSAVYAPLETIRQKSRSQILPKTVKILVTIG